MKIAVINFAAGVGRTTVAEHLLRPRMEGVRLFCSASGVTKDGSGRYESERTKVYRFHELMESVTSSRLAVIDVAASDTGAFIKHAVQSDVFCTGFDMFVIPVTKERNVISESISTIRALSGHGIDPDRIRVVFNKVRADDDLEADFDAIVRLGKGWWGIFVDTVCAVYANEVYKMMKEEKKSLAEIAGDKTDYRELLRSTEKTDERRRLAITNEMDAPPYNGIFVPEWLLFHFSPKNRERHHAKS